MNKNQQFGKHLIAILTEMCRRVDIEFKDVNFNDADWYQKHTWTKAGQDDFVKWMTDYLYKSAEARREITTVYSRNKKQLRSAAEMFCCSYSWSFTNPIQKKLMRSIYLGEDGVKTDKYFKG